ncbi:sensor histidine kinase [Paenibacillus humicola]|uniref:sensor histidine kinase n=1 Tax=Paenibacillus humicola TaxID=3110540 RepID=UPI00237B8736|nr:sensor histidine kinase [Paenibacillus humicola]
MRLFLKEHRGYIQLYYLSILLTALYGLLAGSMPLSDAGYIAVFNSFLLIVFLIWKYVQAKPVYALFRNGFRTIDEAALDRGNSFLGRCLSQLFKQLHRLYEMKLQQTEHHHREHLTFMNRWVHQMKTPLSVIRLQLEAHAGELDPDSIGQEVYKLEKGLSMALSYARLDAFEKDFVIEKSRLRPIMAGSISREKKLFIASGILPKADADEDLEVYTDVKWLGFVLEQLITNGIKYSKGRGKSLTLSAFRKGDDIVLEVKDEGIGIPPQDIRRVFDPFFTGSNGRGAGESTGMGLYIAKKVCESLHHTLILESDVNRGTKASIVFHDAGLRRDEE